MQTAAKRDRRGTISRALQFRVVRAAAFVAVLGTVIAPSIAWTPASAADYPTWEEVSQARNDESAAQSLVNQIQNAVAALQAETARTAADSEAKGLLYQEADQAFQEQVQETATLQEQADAANVLAAQSAVQAGQLAAQLMRGGDPTVNLLVSSGNTDDLLNTLEMSSRVGVQTYLVLEQALQDKNSAQALTDQANEAKALREQLKVEAEAALVAAQAAAVAAAAAAAAAGGIGGVSSAGWTKPVAGRVTDVFGWRLHPIYGDWRLHTGTDLGAGCGAPIFAAADGTVVYAGPNGGYGNFVLIQHSNGIQTGYAHIKPGGIYVGYGQQVGVGTHIAAVGTTGSSTGCHLHLEVRLGGWAVDAQRWVEEQGVRLG